MTARQTCITATTSHVTIHQERTEMHAQTIDSNTIHPNQRSNHTSLLGGACGPHHVCMHTRDISPCACLVSLAHTHSLQPSQPPKQTLSSCLPSNQVTRPQHTHSPLRSTSNHTFKVSHISLFGSSRPSANPHFMRRCRRYCVTFFQSHAKIPASARNLMLIQKLFLSLLCAFHESTFVHQARPQPMCGSNCKKATHALEARCGTRCLHALELYRVR
jgi:hypothetical protein